MQRTRTPFWLIPLAAAVVVVLLRHDFWNWDSPRPLLLGVVPVGLWWQVLVSIGASITLWLCVRFAWPKHLEDEAGAEDADDD